jgi:hypothetical protein
MGFQFKAGDLVRHDTLYQNGEVMSSQEFMGGPGIVQLVYKVKWNISGRILIGFALEEQISPANAVTSNTAMSNFTLNGSRAVAGPKCECGASFVGSSMHSGYCPLS